MNNCGVKIDEDGDEVCHCCQPPHYKIVSTEPWCVCDDNGNHHGYTGLNGVFVCCPAPPEGRPQPIRVGYECGQGCTGCCPNGTIYNIGSDDAGYPIEGCCEEPNKALPFSCCASGQEPVQNIDIYGNRIMRQMDACCPEGYATQAINGQCCSGEVYQNANSGNYECCPEGSTVSNGICCEAGKTGVPNYNSSGTQIGSFCCTENIAGAIDGQCCPSGTKVYSYNTALINDCCSDCVYEGKNQASCCANDPRNVFEESGPCIKYKHLCCPPERPIPAVHWKDQTSTSYYSCFAGKPQPTDYLNFEVKDDGSVEVDPSADVYYEYCPNGYSDWYIVPGAYKRDCL